MIPNGMDPKAKILTNIFPVRTQTKMEGMIHRISRIL